VDGSGRTWSQAITVPFAGPPGPPFVPTITLTSTPGIVLQNLSAQASCQYSQLLTIQETSGFFVLLSKLTAGTQDLSNQIQSIFGTTNLAPYGTLQGTVCSAGSAILAPSFKTFQVTGVSEIGTQVTATALSGYGAALTNPAAALVSPRVVEMLAGSASQLGTGTVNINFTGGQGQWSASIAGRAPWLSFSPLSANGNTPLNLRASAAGLSNGVYDATVAVEVSGAEPELNLVRVVFVVGGSTTTVIDGVSNPAAPSAVFAPGMLASVYGSNLAPSASTAKYIPLPFNLNGVSATVNGISAPMVYVSSGQINLQIPYETNAGLAVLAVNNGEQIAPYILQVNATAPQLFVTPQGFLTPTATAQAGETIAAYMTGEGDVTPFLPTGSSPASGTAANNLPAPQSPVSIAVGGVKAPITFVGIPPGLVGVTQINFTIPTSVGVGLQPVVVTVGGASSSGASIRIVASASQE